MSFDEIINETKKLNKSNEARFVYTFFKNGHAVVTVEANEDGEAVSQIRKQGLALELLDRYIRYNKNEKCYAIFKTL